jgi:hypothetical protein
MSEDELRERIDQAALALMHLSPEERAASRRLTSRPWPEHPNVTEWLPG